MGEWTGGGSMEGGKTRLSVVGDYGHIFKFPLPTGWARHLRGVQ